MAKKKAEKQPVKKTAKKDVPLKVNTDFNTLLGMVINTPPKKKK